MRRYWLVVAIVILLATSLVLSSSSFAGEARTFALRLVSATFDNEPINVVPVSASLIPAFEDSIAPTATFVVTNTLASGTGSLDQAIRDANATPDLDLITFNIPGSGVHTINITAGLTTISQPVTIDGYTQPGASPNTLAESSDAVLLIEIHGINGPTNGFLARAANITIRGVVINGFDNGINVMSGGTSCVFEGNFIGTDPTGLTAVPNIVGIQIGAGSQHRIGGSTPASRNILSGNTQRGLNLNAPMSTVKGNFVGLGANGQMVVPNGFTGITIAASGDDAVVGGTNPADRNVLSGNAQEGLQIIGDRASVQGNYIGTDATGMIAKPNALNAGSIGGLSVTGGTGTRIGGTVPAARNVVSGNGSVSTSAGIHIRSGGQRVVILGNYIGTGADGVVPIGNKGQGISLGTQTSGVGSHVVGGINPGEGNLIANNLAGGVFVSYLGNRDSSIRGNSIHSNIGLAIDLAPSGSTPNDPCDADTGANTIQNSPQILSINPVTMSLVVFLDSVQGRAYKLDFYTSASTGQARTYIGSDEITTDSGCAVSKAVTLPAIPTGRYITATATDPSGNTSELSAALDLSSVFPNFAPVAFGDIAQTTEDVELPIAVLANDFDVDNDTLTVSIVTAPLHGTAMVNPDQTVKYKPADNYFGEDLFTYSISDGHGHTASAQVSISVDPVNDPPVAAEQNLVFVGTGPFPITLVSHDVDNTSVAFAIVTLPTHGTLVGPTTPICTPDGNGGVTCTADVSYLPTAGYIGVDSLVFKTNDGTVDSAEATISINVTNNAGPTAQSATVTTNEDTPLSIGLVATDPEGDALTYNVGDPPHGDLTGTAPNLTYTPDANFFGTDSFTFTVNDGHQTSNVATITINVTAVNDPPTTQGASLSTNEDVDLNITLQASDVENDSLTFALSNPLHGAITGTGPNVTYHPDPNYHGADSFTFTVNDGSATSTPPSIISITVNSVNDPPTAQPASVTAMQGIPVQITLQASDVDGDTLSYTVDNPGPAHGVLSGTAPNLTYTANPGYTGPDGFTFTVRDPSNAQASATVTIDVIPFNSAPVANNVTVTRSEDSPGFISVTATDTEGAQLTFTRLTAPANGGAGSQFSSTSCALQPNGSSLCTGLIGYTPNANYYGPDSFTFKVNDGTLDSAVATIFINVTEVNDPPTAQDSNRITDEDTTLSFPAAELLATASPGPNESGQSIFISNIGTPSHGTAQMTFGTVFYTPDPNYNGPDSFTFTVTDDGTTNGLADPRSVTATIFVNVISVTDLPDLVVGPLNVSGETSPGLPILITTSVRNSGNGLAAPSLVGFYLSVDATLRTSGRSADTLLGEFSISQLAPAQTQPVSLSLSLPGSIRGGGYYIIAAADHRNSVNEVSETNNTFPQLITVTSSDLEMVGVTYAPPSPSNGTSARPNDLVAVSYVVKNNGAGSSPTTTTTINLSGPGGPYPLATQLLEPVSPGQVVIKQINVNIPVDSSAILYHYVDLVVTADAPNQIRESSENNNSASKRIFVTLPNLLPALIGSNPEGGPDAEVRAGSNLDIHQWVANRNDAVRAEATRTLFYLELVGSPGNITFLDTAGVPLLGPSEQYEDVTPHRIPANLTPGLYMLRARADANNDVGESNENDNETLLSLLVRVLSPIADYPDLTVTAVQNSPEVFRGGTITVSDVTRNVGTASTGLQTSVTKYFISLGVQDPGTYIGERSVPALFAGQQHTGSQLTLSIPHSVRPGLYFIVARCDANDSVFELSEFNNRLANPITVR